MPPSDLVLEGNSGRLIKRPADGDRQRVAADEKQIAVHGKKWLYAAIETDSKFLLEVDVFSRRETDPAAAFLHRLTEKRDVADTQFLVELVGI